MSSCRGRTCGPGLRRFSLICPKNMATRCMRFIPTATERGGHLSKILSEDFWRRLLGEAGLPASPTVSSRKKTGFYTYSPAAGIYCEVRETKLAARLSELLLECARACASKFDTPKPRISVS